MGRLVANCLRKSGVKEWVYLDDLLLASWHQQVRESCGGGAFLISKKSMLEPQGSMVWVGKEVEGSIRIVNNSPASLAVCVSFLLRSLVRGRLPWDRLKRCWGGCSGWPVPVVSPSCSWRGPMRRLAIVHGTDCNYKKMKVYSENSVQCKCTITVFASL